VIVFLVVILLGLVRVYKEIIVLG